MHQIKRLTALICALVLFISLLPAIHAYSFPGIDSWAEEEVSAMADLGLIPQALDNTDLRQNITRKVMCQMAMLSYEKYTGSKPEQPKEHPFTDTTDPDIERAKAIGLVDGDGDGLFRPEDSLTRQEFFCFVTKFLRAIDYPITDELFGSLEDYADYKQISDWALEATSLCVGIGIVRGDGSGVAPQKLTKAEEAILMFSRAYALAVAGMESSTPPNNDFVPLPDPEREESTEPAEPGEPSFEEQFPDASSWAVPELTAMNALGLIPSDIKGTSMQGGITRRNMCKIAVLAYQQVKKLPNLKPSKPSPFSDTADADIVIAAELGIVNGYSDGTFRPDLIMTREEYFKISVNLLSALGYPYTDDSSVSLNQFQDANALGWSKPSARLLVSLGILKGSNGYLCPQDSIVCQEAIVLFYRCYQFIQDWEPNSPKDPRPPESRKLAADLVEFACRFEGYPYVYGGQSPSGFDCSGLVYYVYGKFGFSLNRTADRQYYNGTPVKNGEWLPGDLLFFSSNGKSITHVGIYIGNNNMIHASTSTTGVIFSYLLTSYYQQHYFGAVRIIGK